MMSMFCNEAHTIGRMLESCYKYIDYYVLQDNGSTDGTPQIVEEFFKDKNIPGFIYKVEEGWVGFGWNRNHLMQTVLGTDHGCDWILKMDCDETLQVDDDFDWSVFDDKEPHSFHVAALAGNTYYYRAWLYNARYPWKFNFDTAHETVYIDIEGIGENFVRKDLPVSYKHVTYQEGQSYSVPTKYLTDALLLEEKMMKEGTLLTDRYHFWYIGKSYYDCFSKDFYPLKRKHSEEYARRCIFYFTEFINFTHNYEQTGRADRIDEMAYYSMYLMSHVYKYLGDNEQFVKLLRASAEFAPPRNEHWVRLAEYYRDVGQYDEMYKATSKLVDPARKNPFPLYHFLIENNAYYDTGDYVQFLHEIARSNLFGEIQPAANTIDPLTYFKVNNNMNKRLFIVDNFYENPDDVRQFALSLEYDADIRWYKGLRSKLKFRPADIKERFEAIIGEKIQVWEEHAFNGCFQITKPEDPQVYHHDVQKWAGIIYLTPDAPLESGTRLHKAKLGGARHADDPTIGEAFKGGFLDSTKYGIVDVAGNIYNRLIIMDARCIHSAGPYFGISNDTARLIHLFFFD